MLFEMLSGFSVDEKSHDAVHLQGRLCSYGELEAMARDWIDRMPSLGIRPGDCVALTGTLSLSMIAALLALEEVGAIVLPLVSTANHAATLEEASIDVDIRFMGERHECLRREHSGSNALIREFRQSRASSGLMFLTSGSTKRNKIVLHDFRKLVRAVLSGQRHPRRMIIFLMMDHIGGMNSLLHALCNAGTAIFPEDRSVAAVCQLIEQSNAEVLPATPTFLRMMVISPQLSRYDLRSLHTITYGTEPMHASTLHSIRRLLPEVRFKQTYGLTESGIIPTQSRSHDSVWMKVGGDKCPTKVVDGILWVRPPASMIGYLNEPSIVDAEGWINTGDQVEVDGEYLHILGRASEIINVAGEKVYPHEVESVILGMPNVLDVTVTSRRNALTGEVVVALVRPEHVEDPTSLQRRIRAACRQVLRPPQVLALVVSTESLLHGSRFKKLRGLNVPSV